MDRAGALLAQNAPNPLLIGQALDVIDNWRSSHSFPLNTFQVRLRDRSGVVCGRPIVAQRLKRTPSIVQKLRRFQTMKLSQMQDIGGARTVLPTIKDIYQLRDLLFGGRSRHKLANEKDYVKEPKPSGYRGVHLVYRYHSDRSEVYNGLLVELQLRSRLQHAWATAVETVGTFVGQALKSSEGGDEWLRFFELMGSVFALEEASPTGPNTPQDQTVLMRDTRRAAETLHARKRLELFGHALKVIQDTSMTGRYFLLALEPDLESLTVQSYTARERGAGLADYLVAEKRLAGTPGDTVFVASDSLDSLRRAFPNYFADTEMFVSAMDRLLR